MVLTAEARNLVVVWLRRLTIAYESGLTLNSESHRRESIRISESGLLKIWLPKGLEFQFRKVHDLALRSILSSSNPPFQKLFSHFLPRKSRAPFIPTNLPRTSVVRSLKTRSLKTQCSDRLLSIRAPNTALALCSPSPTSVPSRVSHVSACVCACACERADVCACACRRVSVTAPVSFTASALLVPLTEAPEGITQSSIIVSSIRWHHHQELHSWACLGFQCRPRCLSLCLSTLPPYKFQSALLIMFEGAPITPLPELFIIVSSVARHHHPHLVPWACLSFQCRPRCLFLRVLPVLFCLCCQRTRCHPLYQHTVR